MSKRVLVIDDNEDITFLLKTVLDFNGFDVEICSNPHDGIKYLTDHKVDLLLTDYVMDDINGIELIDKARNELNHSEDPIILLTFKDLNESELSLLSKHSALYLKKPFSPDELVQKIESITT